MEQCEQIKASCRCTKEKGTCEGVHTCTSDGCQGSWDDHGNILSFPFGGSDPLEDYILMLNGEDY